MHNTDRTTLETSPYMGEALYQGESGYEGEGEGSDEELVNPYTGEVNQDLEVQLAAELLGVTNEQELDQFLGGLLKKVGKGLSKLARSGAGKAVFGLVKSAAKAALPGLATAGAALIPGAGPLLAPFAGQAAGALGSALGLEVEGMSHEDSQFEAARRVVRVGIDAARRIEDLPEGEVMDEEIWSAISSAARKHLPGLARNIVGAAKTYARGAARPYVQAASQYANQFMGQHAEMEAPAAGFGQPQLPMGQAPARSGRWIRTKGGILLLGL